MNKTLFFDTFLTMDVRKRTENDFFDRLQAITEAVLTRRRKSKRLKQEKQKQKHILLDWIEAFVWAACVVLIVNQYFFQAYQIPSGSMIDTLLIEDRIFVNKLIYGPELLPGTGKIPSPIKPSRNDVVIFESPEYLSRGTVFDIAQRIIYMASLSLYDIDRDEAGRPKAHFLIKRAAGMGGDRFFNDKGDMIIRFSGEVRDIPETEYNKARGWRHTIRRIRKDSLSENIASVKAYCLKLLYGELAPPKIQTFNDFTMDINWYKTLRGAHPHYDGYRHEYYKLVQGWYVPQGRVLPLGDNRDNSRDGRFFGPVKQSKILGKGVFIYWPGSDKERGASSNPLNPPAGKTGFSRIGSIK
ncbi:MAG: S26 family signal peptidase [Spirochaetaceae bacterium]|nr:S26 family signal peptidase [Spirochaetaceae bacterium]